MKSQGSRDRECSDVSCHGFPRELVESQGSRDEGSDLSDESDLSDGNSQVNQSSDEGILALFRFVSDAEACLVTTAIFQSLQQYFKMDIISSTIIVSTSLLAANSSFTEYLSTNCFSAP